MITFGRPRDFAIQLLPLRGAPPEPDPAAAATWVALELHVAGKNLTAHTHEDSGTFHAGIHWPAIYLARWLVRSWAGLFETARWPIATHDRNARDVAQLLDQRILDADDGADEEIFDVRDRFIGQHAMQAAAAGAVLPGVYLARDGSRVSIAWDSPSVGDVAFHRQRGDVDISVESFLGAVQKFIGWTVDELERAGISSDSADRQELSAWLQRLDSPEQARSVLLGYAGLDIERWRIIQPDPATTPESFFELAPGWATYGAAANPMQSPIAVAYRCCSPQLAPAELLAIRDLVRTTSPHPEAMTRLDAIAKRIPDLLGEMRDYEQGYALAVRLRALLGNEADCFDIETYLQEWGVPVQEIELSDAELDGGSVCDDAHGPVIFLNRRSLKATAAWGRRMVLAHELCHLLFDRQQAVPLAIISGPWAPAPIERRANAFAAELLLPLAGIKRRLGPQPSDVTEAQLDELKSAYKVGTTTCLWHLRNRLRWDE